ncbi:hypothetical protein [Psychroserpens sp. SPM9]|uniref:hypothetical protein n=1 Tax=Psychroserpens sp. SPM9 TaxID=2975598 RepID=UPI0021A94FDE|nr:hypothetical protein [Psychroserpens sp. SPM9]MDG5493102.1 hypothetical protein [Psychroserpens sp. SPM9]
MTNMYKNGVAQTIENLFSRETIIVIDINANIQDVWSLLTNVVKQNIWNSTLIAIEGEMMLGGKLKIRSKLAPNKVFKIKVSCFEPHSKMIWRGSNGNRIFTLKKIEHNWTKVAISEKISGLFYPLYKKHIPDFDDQFNQFASDLKAEAEAQIISD